MLLTNSTVGQHYVCSKPTSRRFVFLLRAIWRARPWVFNLTRKMALAKNSYLTQLLVIHIWIFVWIIQVTKKYSFVLALARISQDNTGLFRENVFLKVGTALILESWQYEQS